MELLISNGADVNIPSVGETPLYRAALNGNLKSQSNEELPRGYLLLQNVKSTAKYSPVFPTLVKLLR